MTGTVLLYFQSQFPHTDGRGLTYDCARPHLRPTQPADQTPAGGRRIGRLRIRSQSQRAGLVTGLKCRSVEGI